MTINVFRTTLSASLALCAALSATQPAEGLPLGESLTVGSWQGYNRQGYEVYQTFNQSAGAVALTCDVGAAPLGVNNSGLSVTLREGGLLPPDSTVAVTVDNNDPLVFPTNKGGNISLADCPECRDGLQRLWDMVRRGQTMSVYSADGRSAHFDLTGTASLIPARPCV